MAAIQRKKSAKKGSSPELRDRSVKKPKRQSAYRKAGHKTKPKSGINLNEQVDLTEHTLPDRPRWVWPGLMVLLLSSSAAAWTGINRRSKTSADDNMPQPAPTRNADPEDQVRFKSEQSSTYHGVVENQFIQELNQFELTSAPNETCAYTVKPNDSLDKIAKRELGGSRFLREILELNPGINPDLISINQKIIIPLLSELQLSNRRKGIPEMGSSVERREPLDAELKGLIRQIQFKKHAEGQESSANRIGTPIDFNRKIRGHSRAWGDASEEVRIACSRAILKAFADRPIEEQAAAVAICMHESGLNPDAATPSSTAAGLAQFISATGTELGMNDEETFCAMRHALGFRRFFVDRLLPRCRSTSGIDKLYALYEAHHTNAGEIAINSPYLRKTYEEMLEFLKP
ncbi:MAG: LysM peptidoglycan-binding domain-containing protein [Bdellovibrionales bacterium]|nr:LysM peptidoglycan-binding domain-containing protein [Bdellovibrionales bacterium]